MGCCTALLAGQALVALLATLADCLVTGRLLHTGRLGGAGLTAAWLLLAWLGSGLAVCIRRGRRGDPLPPAKFVLLQIRNLTRNKTL